MKSYQLATILILMVAFVCSESRTLNERDIDGEVKRAKRPFCNAFTGCGRKRFVINPKVSLQDNQMDEELNRRLSRLFNLMTVNSETRFVPPSNRGDLTEGMVVYNPELRRRRSNDFVSEEELQ